MNIIFFNIYLHLIKKNCENETIKEALDLNSFEKSDFLMNYYYKLNKTEEQSTFGKKHSKRD